MSEVTTGIAAIATDGVTRMIFAIFAVGFPLLVFAVFIWMLVNEPANLYPPSQFASEQKLEAFRSLGRQARTNSLVIGEAAAEAVASFSAEKDADVSSRVLKKFESLVEDNSITVDRSALVPGAKPVQIPVSDESTAGELLDAIYFEIAPKVDPFTYGDSWLLVDEGGFTHTEIGTRWAGNNGLARDERPLREVGIYPASKLRVVRAPPAKR